MLCWKRIWHVLLAPWGVNAIHGTILAVSLNSIYSITAKSYSVFDRNKWSEPKLFPFIKMTMTKTVLFKIQHIKSTHQTSDSFTLSSLTYFVGLCNTYHCFRTGIFLKISQVWLWRWAMLSSLQIPQVSAANCFNDLPTHAEKNIYDLHQRYSVLS